MPFHLRYLLYSESKETIYCRWKTIPKIFPKEIIHSLPFLSVLEKKPPLAMLLLKMMVLIKIIFLQGNKEIVSAVIGNCLPRSQDTSHPTLLPLLQDLCLSVEVAHNHHLHSCNSHAFCIGFCSVPQHKT